MSYKGARWYKTDLHLHTPASRCFKDQSITAKEWVDRCLEQGLDVVAVTDHNTGEWIDKIKQAAEGTGLIVFPGVEVTCSEAKVHMLILFDTEKSTEDIEDFLIKIEIKREEFASSEANSMLTTVEVVNKATEEGAIAIPAHIDEFNGLSVVAYNNREEFLDNEHVNSVQVVHEMYYRENFERETGDEILREYYGRKIDENLEKAWRVTVQQALKKKKAILTFSDNPHKLGDSQHGLWGIGQRFTWIKMNQNINIKSLRHALYMPENRIRNDFDSNTNPYSLPDYWFKGIKIKNTQLNQKEIQVDFNPQMTSIIGGRGSGKSSILRFIRGVFQKTQDLEPIDSIRTSSLKKEQEEFFEISNDKSGVLLADSEIEIEVNRFGVDYKIIAKNFKKGQPAEIEVLKKDETDNYIHHEYADINDFFKYEIYSQKQIYEIASHPNSLRNRIDDSIVEMEELTTRLQAKKNEYLEQSIKIRRLKYQISEKEKIKLDIRDKKERIKVFYESEYEELIQKYQKFKEEKEKLGNLKDILIEHKEKARDLKGDFLVEEIDVQEFQEPYQSEVQSLLNPIYKTYKIIQDLLEEIEEKFASVEGIYTSNLSKLNWYKEKKENEEEFEKTKVKLSEDGIDNLGKLELVSNKVIKLENELEEILAIEEDLESQYEKRKEIYEEYIELRKEVTNLRREFLRDILDGTNVQISVSQFRDKDYYIKKFREIIQKPTGFDEPLEKVSTECLQGNNIIKNQRSIYEKILGVRNQVASGYGGHLDNVIKNLNEEQLDELELHFPEDEITVKYKPNEASRFQLLSNASAGQKTSAILTFLLSYGDIPLILDQPEDDLDNHLIYELIVDRLKAVKDNRQIIVVTHNANIPVNGDAEWLVAMDSKSKDIKVLYEGTIEEDQVRTEICAVMEGGERAFTLRAKKYGL